MANNAFFQALDSGNFADVNKFLDDDQNIVFLKDEDERIALHFAAEVADEATFKRILSMTLTTIDAQDMHGFTPLTIAVMNGKLDFMELLIESNAQVNQVDKEKHSLVHWAVVCGQFDALLLLIKHNAVVSLPDIYGAHPLHYATVLEDIPIQRAQAILHVLLKNGAPVECTDIDGRTPILWAASNGNVEAFKSLVQAGGNRLALDRDRLGVLHCAASHGHSEIIRAMLELSSGNIVNVKDRNGDTPLFFAATYGHFDCAKLLLDNLADPNHLDHKLRTPAHCAAAKGQLRILKLLKQYGASFEFQNYRGDLPFHEACHTGSKDLIEWLISFQPNAVNAANFHGRAPLHLAAATGDMELVILLCSRGDEVNALMLYKNELFTPRDVAERRGHDLIVEYLTQRHSALKHVDIPEIQRRMSKTNIEEQLRIARLQQAVASVESEDFLDNKWHPEKPFRRGKSMGNAAYMVNTGVNTSRRSSSASAIRPRLPKSTSTTDLSAGQDKENFNSSEVVHHDRFVGGPEKKLVEETIQKLVHEELKRASALEKKKRRKNGMRSASHGSKHGSHEESENGKEEMILNNELDSENEENFDKVRFENEENENEHYNEKMNGTQKMAEEVSKVSKIRKMRGTNEKMRRSQASTKLLKTGNNMEYRENGKNGEDSGSSSSTKGDPYKPNHKKHLRSTSAKFIKHKDSNPNQTRRSTIENGDENEKFNQEVLKAILNRSGEQDLLYRLKHARSLDESENVDDLVDGRAYIHEKAIFQELTHLKRMQIQYGKVQEKILVRSLINNFCKMHGLNPKHFRYESFYSWEKFLYNQLKLIYLEERDRIQKISSRYPINRFESRLHKTMPLNDRIRELTRIYNGSTSVVTKTNGVKKYRPVTELPCEGQGKRCECLNKHILFE